jgi:putative transposase
MFLSWLLVMMPLGFGLTLKSILLPFQLRCLVHKRANILSTLPKTLQPKAKEAVHQIWQAETENSVVKAFGPFIETYLDKYPMVTLSLQKDREELLVFYDLPSKHWQRIRTRKPIESTYGSIRHRTIRVKSSLNR